jgi:hypothetical protein
MFHRMCTILVLDLDSKLEHLDSLEREQLKQVIYEYKYLFPDIPTRTHKIYHDVDVGDVTPIGNESDFVTLLTFL